LPASAGPAIAPSSAARVREVLREVFMFGPLAVEGLASAEMNSAVACLFPMHRL
jgi:hypothetical protein